MKILSHPRFRKPFALLAALICFTFLTQADGSLPPVSHLPAAPAAGHAGRQILANIREREGRIYRKYRGVAGLRHSHIRVYRGKAKDYPAAMLNDIRVSAERRDFYDAMPAVQVTRYTKDGAEMPPAQFEYNEFMPPHPLFDSHSERHYAMRLRPTPVSIAGEPCYRLDIAPHVRSKRHFVGSLYFRVSALSLLYVRGSYAKLRLGLQSFHFEFYFTAGPDGVPLFTKGYAEGRVYFPLLRDETIVSHMTVENARPIRRHHAGRQARGQNDQEAGLNTGLATGPASWPPRSAAPASAAPTARCFREYRIRSAHETP